MVSLSPPSLVWSVVHQPTAGLVFRFAFSSASGPSQVGLQEAPLAFLLLRFTHRSIYEKVRHAMQLLAKPM